MKVTLNQWPNGDDDDGGNKRHLSLVFITSLPMTSLIGPFKCLAIDLAAFLGLLDDSVVEVFSIKSDHDEDHKFGCHGKKQCTKQIPLQHTGSSSWEF